MLRLNGKRYHLSSFVRLDNRLEIRVCRYVKGVLYGAAFDFPPDYHMKLSELRHHLKKITAELERYAHVEASKTAEVSEA